MKRSWPINNHAYANAVSLRILDGESPDAIVGSLKAEREWTVSTSTLYRYIGLGFIPGVTLANLPYPRRKRKKRSLRRAALAPAGLSIEQRPHEVNSRSTFGHWEMDSVIGKPQGKGQSVLVLTERLTRYELVLKVPDKTAATTNRMVESTLSKFPKGTFKSITVDNGSEFAAAHALPLPVYYCHPFRSSERGSNENANRLIRATSVGVNSCPIGRRMTVISWQGPSIHAPEDSRLPYRRRSLPGIPRRPPIKISHFVHLGIDKSRSISANRTRRRRMQGGLDITKRILAVPPSFPAL